MLEQTKNTLEESVLEQQHAHVRKVDLDYLRKISKPMGFGVLAWNIRTAVYQYVKKLKEESK